MSALHVNKSSKGSKDDGGKTQSDRRYKPDSDTGFQVGIKTDVRELNPLPRLHCS